MSNLNFPLTPQIGDTHSVGRKTWIWNGVAWALRFSQVEGKSAYELALENGFEGSLEDWLDSLKAAIPQAVIDNIIQTARDAAELAVSGDLSSILAAKAAVEAARDHTDSIFAQAQDVINNARNAGEAALQANADEQLARIQAVREAAEDALDSIFQSKATLLSQIALDAQNYANSSITSSQLATSRANDAGLSATAALGAATRAETAATGAVNSAAQALTYAGQSSSSASNAQGSAATALAKQGLATQAAVDAGASAAAAHASEQSASSSATAAGSYAVAADTSRIQAQTKATEAGNSATAAAGHASTAESNSTLAAQRAAASEQSRLSATIAASQLFPSTFENPEMWTNVISGETPATATLANFVTDSSGRVYQKSGAASTILATKGYLIPQAGRRYRLTARVRLKTLASDLSGNLVSINLAGLSSIFSQTSLVSLASPAVGVVGSGTILSGTTWVLIGVDFVISPTETAAFLRPYVSIGGNDNGSVVQVSFLKIEDTTESNRAGVSAQAAVDTLSQVEVRATEVQQYAQSSLTSSTNASTSASQASNSALNANQSASTASTKATQASESATSAQGSAAIAFSAAQVATQSKNDAGVSANSAALESNSAASSANDAAIAAAAAQSYMVQAQLNADALYPSTFADTTDYVVGGDATHSFITVDATPVLEFSHGTGTVHHTESRPLVANRRYKVVVEARALQDTDVATTLVISRLNTRTQTGVGDFTNGDPSSITTEIQNKILLASDGWVTFAREYTMANNDKPYIRSYFTAKAVKSGSPSDQPKIQIRLVAINDITDAYNAGRSAAASAESASQAAVSQTLAGQAATSAIEASTSAAVKAGEASLSAASANTSKTQASLAAQDALGAASLASQSESNAASSATLAGTKATAASNSASFAATKADEASNSSTSAAGFASNAATSSSNSLGSANASAASATIAGTKATEAGNSAYAASQSALTATNKAADATTAATSAQNSSVEANSYAVSAQQSSQLAASFGTGTVNKNAVFGKYTSATGFPDDWNESPFGASGATRVTNENGNGYALQLVSGTGSSDASSTSQTLTNLLLLNSWWVLEADVKLVAGSFNGAGVILRTGLRNSIDFFTDKDTTDTVVGAGTTGKVYRFRKLVQILDATSSTHVVTLGNHIPSLSTTYTASNTIVWYKCGLRPATLSEIAAQRADINASQALANITSEASTRATADTALATRATNLEAIVNDPANGNLALKSRIATEESARSTLETTQANRSSVIESAIGATGIVANPYFSNYLSSTGLPTYWTGYGDLANYATKVVGETANRNAIKSTVPSNAPNNPSLVQSTVLGSAVTNSYYVVELDLRLDVGSLQQMTATLGVQNASAVGIGTNSFALDSTADISGTAPGTGTAGKTYRYRVLQQVTTANASRFELVLSFRKDAGVAQTVTVFGFNVRFASDAEVLAKKADATLNTPTTGVVARLTTEESTRASADTALATRATSLEAAIGPDDNSGLRARIKTEETTRATADTALASRSSALESTSGVTGYFKNVNFSAWNVANTLPDGWTANGTITKVSGPAGGYGVRISGASNSVTQDVGNQRIADDGWIVLEIDFALISGNLVNAGYGFTTLGVTDYIFRLSTETSSGETLGSGIAGKTYRVRRMLKLANASNASNISLRFYGDNPSYFGPDDGVASVLEFYRVNARPATDSEILTQKINTDLYTPTTGVVARLTTEESTRASADGALATRATNLEAAIGPDDNSGLRARIKTEETARANADTALATRATNLEATVGADDNATGSLKARIKTEETARANADSALATRTSSLESSIGADDNATGSIKARIKAEETARSNADSALTTRYNSLESSLGSQGLVKNSKFLGWPDGSTYPTNWVSSNNSDSNIVRVAGEAGAGYAMRLNGPANGFCYPRQDTGPASVSANQWVVMEADVALLSGSFSGAGLFMETTSPYASYNINFFTDKDITDTVVGAGTTGKIYRFRKLVQISTSTGGYAFMYPMAHNSVLGDISQANSVVFYLANLRYATDSEIATRKVDLALNTPVTGVLARLTTEESTRATADSALATRATNLEAAIGPDDNSGLRARIKTEETARATADTALAARSSSLESTYGQTGFVKNPQFARYADAAQAPEGWTTEFSSGSVVYSRAVGETTSYAAQIYSPASTTYAQLFQTTTIQANQWVVIESDVQLVSGTFESSGSFIYLSNQLVGINYFTDKDITDTVVGAGTTGKIYRFRKLVQNTVGSNPYFYICGHQGLLGGTGTANQLIWYKANVRPATDAEVLAKKADISLNTPTTGVVARLTTEESTRATADSALATRATNLEAAIGADDNATGSLKARIKAEETARANADSALATRTTSVESSYTNLSKVINNDNFDNGVETWDSFTASMVVASSNGRRNVVRTPAGSTYSTVQGRKIAINSDSQRFKLRAGWRCAAASATYYFGVAFYDANDSSVAASDGTGNYPLGHGFTASSSTVWMDREVVIGKGVTDASPYGGTRNIPAAAAYFRPIMFINYLGVSGSVTEIDYFAVDDVTSVEQANARITTEESARTTADSALATRATNLESAIGADDNATGSLKARIKTEETTRAAADTALASRSSTLESKAGGAGSLNTNATFSLYTNATGAADNWASFDSNGSGNYYRVPGENGVGYAMRGAASGNQQLYTATTIPQIYQGGWYVVEADVKLNAGRLDSSGVYLSGSNSIGFYNALDISGTSVGAGVVGNTYRFRFLIQATTGTTGLYTMSHWNGLPGDFSQTIDLTWYRCAIRPASDAEVLAKKADISLNTPTTGVVARLTTEESTRASADTALATRATNLESAIGADDNAAGSIRARIKAEETTRATQTAALAVRSTNLESSVNLTGSSSLNINPNFSNWPDGQELPTGWAKWSFGGTLARAAGLSSRGGYEANMTVAANTDHGISVGGVEMPAGYYVIEVEANLASGTWQGSGMTLNGSYSFELAATADINEVVSTNAAGNRKWAVLMQVPSGTYNFYLMMNWSNWSIRAAKQIYWKRFSVRAASQAEILAKKADATLNTPTTGVVARLTTEESTRATADSALATRATNLEAAIGPDDNSGLRARIKTEETTRANADGALATRATNLESAIGPDDSSGLRARIKTEETARANADSALATRYNSLESSLGSQGLVKNSKFLGWPDGSTYPTNWLTGNGSDGNTVRVTGEGGAGYAMRLNGPAGGNCYPKQDTGSASVSANQWVVMEADVELISGSFSGAGLFMETSSSYFSYSINFFTDKDITDTVVGAGTTGKIYRFRKLVQISTSTGGYASIYPMAHYSGLGNISQANSVVFYLANLRYASDSEIATRKVDLALNTPVTGVLARLTTEETTRANQTDALANRASSLEAAIGADDNAAGSLRARIKTEETARANAVSAVASRTSSLETSIVNGGSTLNQNASFSYWPDPATIPNGWSVWNGSGTFSRVTNTNSSAGYIYRANVGNAESGIYQGACNVQPGYYVLEADIQLLDGDLRGAGITLSGVYSLHFATDPDINGTINQGGLYRRRFTKLVKVNQPLDNWHLMNNWFTFGATAPSKQIYWYYCGIRPASAGEIIAQKADDSLNTPATGVVARITAEETARTNGDSALALRATSLEAQGTNSGNLVPNTAFATLDGWTVTNAPSPFEFLNNGAGNSWQIGGVENNLAFHQANFVGPYNEVQSTPFAVNPGSYIQFYAITAAHRSAAWVSLFFYDGNGGYIGYAGDYSNTASGGRNINDWAYTGKKSHQVPTSAVNARMVFRQIDGTNDPYTWFSRPYVGVVKMGTTEWNAYSPGSDRQVILTTNASIKSEESARINAVSAVATRTSTLEATAGRSGFLNANATFANPGWTTQQSLPPSWATWAGEGSPYIGWYTGVTPSNYGAPYALQIDRQGANCGIQQLITGQFPRGFYVLEADIRFEDGNIGGAGMHVNWQNGSSGQMDFYNDMDSTGTTHPAGNINCRYSKLIYNAQVSTVMNLYLMAGWNTFSVYAGFLRTIWHRAGIRPATDAEVKLGRVGGIEARVTTSESAITGLNGRTAAYWQTTAVAGNNRAQLTIKADANAGAGVDIVGDVSISGNLMVSGSINSGKLAPSSVQQVAVSTLAYNIVVPKT